MASKIHSSIKRIRVSYMLVIVAVAVVWLGVRAFLRYTPPGVVPQASPMSLIEMHDVVLNGYGDKDREWMAEAERVDISQDRSMVSISNISGCTLFRDQKPVASLQAANAVANLWSKRISVFGSVSVFNDAGQRLETSAVTWEPAKASLNTSGKVVYKSRNGDVAAEKAQLNVKTKEMILIKPRMSLLIQEADDLR